jgi:hypothetical protein
MSRYAIIVLTYHRRKLEILFDLKLLWSYVLPETLTGLINTSGRKDCFGIQTEE